MFDRSKIYGYTEEQIEESCGYLLFTGYEMVVCDEPETFTKEEIDRMFPEQALLLINVIFDDSGRKTQSTIVRADILCYMCKLHEAQEMYQKRGQKSDDFVYVNAHSRWWWW